MRIIVVIAALIAMLIVSAATSLVNSKLDHKSFEKCWKESIKTTGVDESLLSDVKPSVERKVMSGNLTLEIPRMTIDTSDPNNKLEEDIYNCMLSK